MIPELLEANAVAHQGPIRFELTSRREEQLRLAWRVDGFLPDLGTEAYFLGCWLSLRAPG